MNNEQPKMFTDMPHENCVGLRGRLTGMVEQGETALQDYLKQFISLDAVPVLDEAIANVRAGQAIDRDLSVMALDALKRQMELVRAKFLLSEVTERVREFENVG